MASSRSISSYIPVVFAAFAVLVPVSGCVRALTAPAREERREKAEAMFARLAAFTPEQIANFVDQRMDSKLALTATEDDAVKAIDLKYARQLHDTAASADAPRSKLRAIHDQDAAKESDLKAVLTPDQFSHYLELREQMKEQFRTWAEAPK